MRIKYVKLETLLYKKGVILMDEDKINEIEKMG